MSKYKTNPIGVCELCNMRSSSQWHHKFPQTVINRKRYGKLIDHQFNLCKSCGECNVSHAHIPKWASWDERKFRNTAEKLKYVLPKPLKSFKE